MMADDLTESTELTKVTETSPAIAPRAPAVAALAGAATRLLQVLESESAALRQRRPADLEDFCDRKNQALLELSRIGQKLDPAAIDPDLQALLTELRERLEENREILSLHLRAVREVADTLATAIREAESDGTYSTSGAAGSRMGPAS